MQIRVDLPVFIDIVPDLDCLITYYILLKDVRLDGICTGNWFISQ